MFNLRKYVAAGSYVNKITEKMFDTRKKKLNKNVEHFYIMRMKSCLRNYLIMLFIVKICGSKYGAAIKKCKLVQRFYD